MKNTQGSYPTKLLDYQCRKYANVMTHIRCFYVPIKNLKNDLKIWIMNFKVLICLISLI